MMQIDLADLSTDDITTEYGEDVRITHELIDGEPHVLIESACMRGEVLEFPSALARVLSSMIASHADAADREAEKS